MQKLIDKIRENAAVLSDGIIDVDSFISQQVDVALMDEAGKEIAKNFEDQGITKVFTIESSGITPAAFAAKHMDLPLVILKKKGSRTQNPNRWQTEVISPAKETSYELTLACDFINENDHILLVDDFLADGEAATGAVRLIRRAHATVAGMAVLIDKTYCPGEGKLKSQGIPVFALAKIASADENGIAFE